ncbi:hypothetical protein BGZ83_001151 [Gryganskiella cystojenkinii]|nr:hypothetical protein BGZ83_001151 [Gryganskiella cystojenkinii]
MNLPEIRLGVGQYLKPGDLARCIRVSKAWHLTFIPLVYREVILPGEFQPGLKIKVPPAASIERHGQHIDHMLIGIPGSFTLPSTVTNVRLLKVSPTVCMHGYVPGGLEALRSVLIRNPKIEVVQLEGWTDCLLYGYLNEISRLCPQLTDMTIDGAIFEIGELALVLRSGKHMESFSLERCKIQGMTAKTGLLPKGTRFPGVHTVQLKSCGNFQQGLNLLCFFPGLKTHFVDQHERDPSEAPYDWSPLSKCTQLDKLVVTSLVPEGQDLKKALENFPKGVTDLTLHSGCKVDKTTFVANKAVFQSLTNLNLGKCEVGRGVCDQVLWTCGPNLVHYQCAELDSDDVFFGRPGYTRRSPEDSTETRLLPHQRWTATGVKKLLIETLHWSMEPDRNQLLNQLFATLTNMEIFYAAIVFPATAHANLSQFASFLNVKEVQEQMDREDAKDPKKKWKRVEYLSRAEMVKDKRMEFVLGIWPNLQEYAYDRYNE